jgi:hypothetical protein
MAELQPAEIGVQTLEQGNPGSLRLVIHGIRGKVRVSQECSFGTVLKSAIHRVLAEDWAHYYLASLLIVSHRTPPLHSQYI